MATGVHAAWHTPVRAACHQSCVQQPYADEEGTDEESGHRERDQGHGEGALDGRELAGVVAAAGLGDLEAAAEALEEAGEGEAETVAEADEVLVVLAALAALAVRRDGQGDRRDEEESDRPERGQGRTSPVAPEGSAEEGTDG
jgi:hypothetical protein